MITGKAMIDYKLHYFKSILDCFKYINDNEIGKTEEFINSFTLLSNSFGKAFLAAVKILEECSSFEISGIKFV